MYTERRVPLCITDAVPDTYHEEAYILNGYELRIRI